MSYKAPCLPSARSYIEEKADYWEINSLLNKDRFYSHREIAKALSIELDEFNHDGTVSEDEFVFKTNHPLDNQF